MEMVPGVLLSEEQNIPQEKEKYAAYKSVPIFLKSVKMKKMHEMKNKNSKIHI